MTAGGLLHLKEVALLEYLGMSGVAAGSINDTVLYNLQKQSYLAYLVLGRPDGPPVTTINVSAITRSVRLHEHTQTRAREHCVRG